jgi:hypothetical protein
VRLVEVSVSHRSVPSTRTARIAPASPLSVTTISGGITTIAPTAGTRPSFQVAGVDQSPLRTAVCVASATRTKSSIASCSFRAT